MATGLSAGTDQEVNTCFCLFNGIGNRVVQRQVLYLGEVNDAQQAAWCKTIEVVQEAQGDSHQMAIFPEDRVVPAVDCDVVQVRLSDLQLKRAAAVGSLLVGV